MRRLIPDVPFCDNDYYPCGPVALDSILQYYRYSTPLVIHGEWFFMYQLYENGELRVSSRLTPLIHDLQRCGVYVTEHQEPDGETAWKHVKSRIDKGKPVPALADTHYLEALYYPGLGHHSDHSVILAGYDDVANTVHVVDPSPGKRFRGDLPLSGFKKAWGSKHISRYTWMELQFPDPRWTLTAEQAVQGMLRNMQLMRLENAPEPNMYFGLRGLRRLACDLIHWKKLEPDRARDRLKHMFDQLRQVVMERDGHGEYLKLGAGVLNDTRFTQVGNLFRGITQKWVVFRNLCYKAQTKALIPTLDKLHSRLLEIANLEAEALARLEKIVTSDYLTKKAN